MSQQLKKALNEINTVSLLTAELVTKLSTLQNTPSTQMLRQSADIVIKSVYADKAMKALAEKSGDSSLFTYLNELAILVTTRSKKYQGQLRKLIHDADSMIAQGINMRATGMGFSLFEPSSWFSSDESTNRELGLSLLRSYFDTAKTYPSFTFSSFDQFLSNAESKVENFATNVGELVKMNVYSTSESEARSRLSDLAKKSQGLASLSQIIAAAGGSGNTVNWSAVVPEVTAEASQGVLQAGSEFLQNTGAGVLSTLNLVKYLPWFVVGGGLIYLVIIASKHGASTGRAIEDVARAGAERIRRGTKK